MSKIFGYKEKSSLKLIIIEKYPKLENDSKSTATSIIFPFVTVIIFAWNFYLKCNPLDIFLEEDMTSNGK